MNVNNCIKEIVSFWSSIPQAIKKLVKTLVVKTTEAYENRFKGNTSKRLSKIVLKGAFWFFLLKGLLWIGFVVGAYIWSK